MHPLVLLLIIVGIILMVRWFNNPAANRPALDPFKLALYLAGGILVLALITGRLNPLIALIAAAIPALQRLSAAKQIFERFRSGAGPRQGGTSKVTTAMLEMQLDHDSGELTGKVLSGQHSGALLADLAQPQLLDLLAECQTADAQSAAVLTAYLDRRFGHGWRAGEQSNAAVDPVAAPMSEVEAREILGVSPQARRAEIIAAHKQLIQKLHPDRGGSNYLAIKVNQARDYLLERV